MKETEKVDNLQNMRLNSHAACMLVVASRAWGHGPDGALYFQGIYRLDEKA